MKDEKKFQFVGSRNTNLKQKRNKPLIMFNFKHNSFKPQVNKHLRKSGCGLK
jgi:hypothetical protein